MSDYNNVPQIAFTTPRGKFLWPRLQEPDTKFDEDGTYSCDIILSGEDAAPLVAKLEQLFEENLAYQRGEHGKKVRAANSKPWREEMEDDDETPTGRIIFRSKLPALVRRKGKDPVHLRPKLFDAHAEPLVLKEGEVIGTGSTGKLMLQARGWYVVSQGAGVKLSLKAAQVIKLEKAGPQTAEDFGFTDESGEQFTPAPEGEDNGGDF